MYFSTLMNGPHRVLVSSMWETQQVLFTPSTLRGECVETLSHRGDEILQRHVFMQQYQMDDCFMDNI